MLWRLSRFFKSWSLCITIITFFFAFWKLLLILKMLTETLPRIPFSVIGRCSPVSTTYWLQGKCATFTCLVTARRLSVFTVYGSTWGFQAVCIFSVKIAALVSLKRTTEIIFKLVISQEHAKTFFNIKITKNCKKHQRIYSIVVNLEKKF